MPAEIMAIAAVLSCMLSAATFYLASPNQRILKKPFPKIAMYSSASLCFCFSAFALNTLMTLAPTIFSMALLYMMVWALLPFVGVLDQVQGRAK
ncbi:hypothetical protein [Kordiimonas pumila]|uniref:Uncharacterized protein n=1 Tax=Kordiimonas pumila TaxID=2161677 RepID=A0ABV7D7D3_9PROT|nr:hypothetical protein [Kordiimonas pumila]